MTDGTYRGFFINEVCARPFAHDGAGTHLTAPPGMGMDGLVTRIDAHLREESVRLCNALLEDRAEALRAGQWGTLSSRRMA